MGTNKLTGIALLIAVTCVLTILSSYIQISGIAINLSLVPIIVAAALYGPIGGIATGLANGVMILISPSTSVFYAASFVGTIIICLSKSTLAGYVASLIFKLFKNKNNIVATIIASIVVPLINTVVFIILALIFYEDLLGTVVSAFLSINFLIEIAVTLLLSTTTNAVIKIGNKKHN